MPSDPRDYRLDIAGVSPEPAGDRPKSDRPFIGVRFDCCGAYCRVYRSSDGTRYDARCPRCGRSAVFRIGEGGTSERLFVVR